MTFQEKLDRIVKKNKSLVCVGLDQNLLSFNKTIIEATHDLVCSYKLNTAFYESIGYEGVNALKDTCDYLKEKYPEIPIIIDAKRGDIGNTNNGYVQFIFPYLGADAVTVHPYLGEEAIRPFLDLKDKGIIILCKTSNVGSGEFQNLQVQSLSRHDRTKIVKPLYQIVAENVAKKWNKNKNCMLVVGATYPDELKEVRKIVGDMTFLVPGVGAQGGDVEKTVKAGLNSKGSGMIINSSRGIIFASSGPDFAEVARREAIKLKEEINKYR